MCVKLVATLAQSNVGKNVKHEVRLPAAEGCFDPASAEKTENHEPI